MTRTWPKDAPDAHEHQYMMFTLDHSEVDAAAEFESRYGEKPEWIIEHLGNLYVGPIPEAINE